VHGIDVVVGAATDACHVAGVCGAAMGDMRFGRVAAVRDSAATHSVVRPGVAAEK